MSQPAFEVGTPRAQVNLSQIARSHTSLSCDAQDQEGYLINKRRKGCLYDEFKDGASKQIFVLLIGSIQFHNIDTDLNSNMLLRSHRPYSWEV